MIPKQYLYYVLGGSVVFVMFLMWTSSDYQNEMYSFHNDITPSSLFQSNIIEIENETGADSVNRYRMKHENLKSILIWTSPKTEPFSFLGEAQEVFTRKKCPVTNCYVTSNKHYFNNVNLYDVLLFHVPEIHDKQNLDLPVNRSPHQLYVFASMESADYYPLCSKRLDNVFNLTWTYKLNSDIFYGYIVVKNKNGDIIGPNQIMHWKKVEDMEPVDNRTKEKLKHKTIAAAWFVSNCYAPSGRDKFVEQVQNELHQYKLVIDIYGKCGKKMCPRGNMGSCLNSIERDYYFYFSFENSFAVDYVTEKLLHALNHYAVPVVYGIANYTRFMPDGSYLNALELGAKELAKQMVEIINDKEKYYNFFKWRNHYTYHDIEEVVEIDPYCKLCEKVNSVTHNTKVYENLKDWWNPKKIRPNACSSKGFWF